MRVPDAEVRRQILESVKSFYSCVAPKQLLDGTDRLSKPKPRTFYTDSRFSRLSLSEALSSLCGGMFVLLFLFFVFYLSLSFLAQQILYKTDIFFFIVFIIFP